MLPPVLSPIIPRLFLIGFRYAQPVLISISIRVLRASSDQPAHKGLLVIPMAAVIYIGLAVGISSRSLVPLRILDLPSLGPF